MLTDSLINYANMQAMSGSYETAVAIANVVGWVGARADDLATALILGWIAAERYGRALNLGRFDRAAERALQGPGDRWVAAAAARALALLEAR